MARQIESTNTYKDVLLKLIPSEIVAAYMVIDGLIPIDKGYSKWIALGTSAFLLVLTPFYLRKLYKMRAWSQILFTMGSFVIWVYWMGGPFKLWNLHLPALASIFLVLWTLLIPLFNLPSEFNKGQTIEITAKRPKEILGSDRVIAWAEEMKKYLGKPAHINKVDRGKRAVRLDVDQGKYWWSFDWIRKVEGEDHDSKGA